MSVYRDTNASVVFEHPYPGPLTATVYRDSEPILTVDTLTPTMGRFTLPLTWRETAYDGTLTVAWSADDFAREQTVEVVTPIVALSRLKALYEDDNPHEGDLAELETTVRLVIESYSGQKFGYSVGSRTYVGNGSGRLILNERCAKLRGILGVYGGYPDYFVSTEGVLNLNGELNLSRATVTQDGWGLAINFDEYLSTKQPSDVTEGQRSPNGVIRVPRSFARTRDLGAAYTLTGVWGYSEVPADVQEAALLLANDYLTGDSGYRDRYLSILKIQQDSFTYHAGAFRGTGNARVDLLLGPYRRKTGMIVL